MPREWGQQWPTACSVCSAPVVRSLPTTATPRPSRERWKHLIQLIQRQMLIYPGHSKARRTRVWKRFRQQMVDVEKVMKGQYLLVEAPNEREAHEDYVDSLALACCLHRCRTAVPVVEQMDSPFFNRA